MTAYLNTKQAAEKAGVSPRTIIEWIHHGRLPAFRNASARGHFKILETDLMAAITYTPSADG